MIEAQVIDRRALAARSPSELAMYLRAHDWESRGRGVFGIQWIKVVDGDEYEALQPTDSRIRDYEARVRDVLHVVAVAEGRSELDVLQAISNVSMDVHSVRIFPADVAPGMIGLDDGIQAYESL